MKFQTIHLVILLLLVGAGGTFLAMTKPASALATPFKGVATIVLEISSETTKLIDLAFTGVAEHERSTVVSMLNWMKGTRDLKEIPPVTVATNDMASFPSPEHPLFPEYVDKRFTQFKYTIDNNGVVIVDRSETMTRAIIKKIEQLLQQIEETR